MCEVSRGAFHRLPCIRRCLTLRLRLARASCEPSLQRDVGSPGPARPALRLQLSHWATGPIGHRGLGRPVHTLQPVQNDARRRPVGRLAVLGPGVSPQWGDSESSTRLRPEVAVPPPARRGRRCAPQRGRGEGVSSDWSLNALRGPETPPDFSPRPFAGRAASRRLTSPASSVSVSQSRLPSAGRRVQSTGR